MDFRCSTRFAAFSLLATIASSHAGVPAIRAEPIVTADSPTYLTSAPGDETRLFVTERGGMIRVLVGNAFLDTPFLDLTDVVVPVANSGLLGLAFHPDYETNGFFYVHYTPAAANGIDSVIARFTVSADPNIADRASEQTVLRLDQPHNGHNGGWLGFGPFDGYLYIPFGDGGRIDDWHARAQDPDGLFGKLLRLDVDGDDFPGDPERNYAIPADNPFVGGAGADEIWALGLRNPYRASFDRANGNLWISDVGEFAFEEVDVIHAASIPPLNFGWGCKEGPACLGAACLCTDPSLTDPEMSYSHDYGLAVTASVVYRGCAIPELDGTLFVADYGGSIWAVDQVDGDTISVTDVTAMLQPPVGPPLFLLVALGEDARGELYIVSISGAISKIVPDTPIVPDPCNPCPGDIDGSADVGFSDLSTLLAAWGPCTNCAADLDGNDDVGFSDLSTLLAKWGPCP